MCCLSVEVQYLKKVGFLHIMKEHLHLIYLNSRHIIDFIFPSIDANGWQQYCCGQLYVAW